MKIYFLFALISLSPTWTLATTEFTPGEAKDVQTIEQINQFQKTVKQLDLPLGAQKSSCAPGFSSVSSTFGTSGTSENQSLFKKRLLSTFNELEKKLEEPITPTAIFKMMSFIESNQISWQNHPQSLPVTYSLKSKKGESIPVQIDLDGNNSVVIAFPKNHIGDGAFNTVHKVFSYGTWDRVATTAPHNENIAQRPEFISGLDMYRKIASVPKKDRPGVVDVISVKGKRTYQKMYDTDLMDAFIKPKQKLSSDDKIEIIKQLSKGVISYHKLGIIHSDIKPDNALLEYPDSKSHKKLEAVYGDPGLAYLAKDHLDSGPPRRGTLGYMPPHVFIQSERKTPEENLHDLTSVDVYGHAQTAYITLYEKYHPCMEPGEKKAILKLMTCLDNEWNKEVKDSSFNPERLVIQEGLHSKANKQITPQTFADAFDALPPQPKLKGGAHSSVEAIQQALKDHPGFLPTSDSHKINDALRNQPEGTYTLFPMANPNSSSGSAVGYGIGIAWQTKGYGVTQKILQIDPHQQGELEQTIKFLKTLGSIQTPVQPVQPVQPGQSG